MKSTLTALLLCTGILMSATGGVLAQQKIGYLNTALIMSEMPEVRQADQNLDALRKQLLRQGEQMVEALERKFVDAQERYSRGEMTPVEQSRVEQNLQEEEAKISQFEQQMQENLMKKRNELLTPIIDKINKAVEDVAKEGGFSFILDASSGSILYADDKQDITPLVKRKLGMP